MKSCPKVLFVLASSVALTLQVRATTLTVPTPYATIQSAINAANSGDEVHVSAGTYRENVYVTKSIILSSDSGAHITTTNSLPAISVEADDVLISDFKLTTTGAPCVYAEGMAGLVVYNVEANVGSIMLWSSMGGDIVYCTVNSPLTDGIVTVGNGCGGGTRDSISYCIVNSSAAGTATGIAVRNAELPVDVYRNSVRDTLRGIEVSGSCNTTVSVYDNWIYSRYDGSQPLYFSSGDSVEGGVSFTLNTVNTESVTDTNVSAVTINSESNCTLAVTGDFNRLVAPKAVTRTGAGDCTANLTNNWWGRNTNIVSDVSVSPWLTMRATPQSATVTPGNYVTITVDWFINSDNQDVSGLGYIPQNDDGYFQADAGYFSSTGMMVRGGYATVDFYPDGACTATANIDYESVSVLCNQ